MLDERRWSIYRLSVAQKSPNIPKHRHGISLREVSVLADAFKELPDNGELETEVVFCPRLVKFDLQWKGKKRQAPNE
jgi:hypothetical protein